MTKEERKAWLEQFEWQDTDEVLCLAEKKMLVFTAKFLATEGNQLDWSKPKKLLRLVDGEIVEVEKKAKPRVYLCNVCGKPICSDCLPHTCLNPTYQEHPLWRYFNWTDWRSDREAGMVVLKAARDWVRDQIIAGKL